MQRTITLDLDETAKAIVDGLIKEGKLVADCDMQINMDFNAHFDESKENIIFTGCVLKISS